MKHLEASCTFTQTIACIFARELRKSTNFTRCSFERKAIVVIYLFAHFCFICIFFVLCVRVCQTCCVIYGLKELHVSSANVCEGHVWDFWAIMFNSLTGWHASKTRESFLRLCHFFFVCVTLFFPNYRSGSQVLKHCSAAHLTFLFAPQTPYNAERVVGWFYRSGTCF